MTGLLFAIGLSVAVLVATRYIRYERSHHSHTQKRDKQGRFTNQSETVWVVGPDRA